MMKKLLFFSLLLILSISLAGCKKDDEETCKEPNVLIEGECIDPDTINDGLFFELIGNKTQIFSKGDDYFERGFIAKDEMEFISESVSIDGEVNMQVPGVYTVEYTLDYNDYTETLKRDIIVVDFAWQEVEDTNLIECFKVWSQYLHTKVELSFYVEREELKNVLDVFDQVEEIIVNYHVLSDKYTMYETYTNVWTINQDPTATHIIDQDLYDLIEFTLVHQGDVNDLFNAALGPVLQVWHDYREVCIETYDETLEEYVWRNTENNEPCEIPQMSELLAQKAYTDPTKIILNPAEVSITMEENMSIDLGGVSKGYISREIIEYLDGLNLHGYLLNNGQSNISIGGLHKKRESGEFILAVTDPENHFYGGYYATVNLRSGDQLVTSGDYQQYFQTDDGYYHHIIHNDTLMPERYNRSVSIVTSDPALADLYSTAIFLMPTQEGIDFVNNIDGLEGIWYDIEGTIHMSDNFETFYLRDIVTAN